MRYVRGNPASRGRSGNARNGGAWGVLGGPGFARGEKRWIHFRLPAITVIDPGPVPSLRFR